MVFYINSKWPIIIASFNYFLIYSLAFFKFVSIFDKSLNEWQDFLTDRQFLAAHEIVWVYKEEQTFQFPDLLRFSELSQFVLYNYFNRVSLLPWTCNFCQRM